MEEARIRELACAHLGVEPEQVRSLLVYADYVTVVVDRGTAGCPKYRINLTDLQEPPAEEDQVEQLEASRKVSRGKRRGR